MLNKFERRDIELIRIVAEKGMRQDALASARRFLHRAGADKGRRDARIRALAGFLPEVKGWA